VIYDIKHVTVYEYGSTVTFNYCALRLLPQDGPGQRVLETKLHIDPAPKEMQERTCFFGNRVTSMMIETAHRELTVVATSVVEVDRPKPPDPATTGAWEFVREEAFDSESLGNRSPAQYLHPSRYVPRFAPATDYARESFTDGRPVLDAAVELMRRIRKDFTYDPTSTVISTPLSQAFAQKSGVCQDFAHIMIAGLRGLGLPAAYISGYIRTIPLDGTPKLEGSDAMHAWVSLWCGGGVGWVGLDPTNSTLVNNDHVMLAEGRDYADISPVAGIVTGAREQDIDVKVDVVPRRG
jgi:transglutaminase-like putative cysteine protease